jgi:tryptophan synthase beta chain
LSQLVDDGVVEAMAHGQNSVFQAAVQFARAEGIVPAPESAHAIRAAVDEALAAKEAGDRRVILFNLSGHGHFDMGAYDAYLAGALQDYAYPTEAIQRALAALPNVAVSV